MWFSSTHWWFLTFPFPELLFYDLKTLSLDYTHIMWQQKSLLQVYELGYSCKSILKIMAVCHINLDFECQTGVAVSESSLCLDFKKKKNYKRQSLVSLRSHVGTWFSGRIWCRWDISRTCCQSHYGETVPRGGLQWELEEGCFILKTSPFASELACPSPSLHVGTTKAGCWESELLERTVSCTENRGSCHRQVLPDFRPKCSWSADWYHRKIKLLKWKLWQSPIFINLLRWMTLYSSWKI